MSELKEKEYKRKNFKDYGAIETLSDSSDIFDIAINSLEKTKTRPPVYSNDEEGLKKFKDMSLEYIKELRERNIEAENSKRMRLIPSIEMWATYLGVTRQTIHTYERTYNEDYYKFIQQFKNVIATIKKELAENGKIPPVIHIFDFVNNHSYLNTNAVTIETSEKKESIYSLPSERLKIHTPIEQKSIEEPTNNIEEIDINELPFMNKKG